MTKGRGALSFGVMAVNDSPTASFIPPQLMTATVLKCAIFDATPAYKISER
jgi:hypothetical protein